MMRQTFILIACLALAACGQKQSLKPPVNAPAPPKPATAPAAASPTDLLKQQPTERPGRSDELLTKSEPRQDDPFDQPPK